MTGASHVERESLGDLTARAHALRYADVREAVELATRAIRDAEPAGDVENHVRALRIRGACLAQLADSGAADRDLDCADALLDHHPDPVERAWVLTARASVHFLRGDFTSAIRAAQQALVQQREVGNHIGEADTLNTVGCIADGIGDHAKALQNFRECRRIFEAEHDFAGLGYAVCNIALIHGRLGENAYAIEQFDRALALTIRAGNRTHESVVHLNLGVAHAAGGHVEQALAHATEGLRLARELGTRKYEVQGLTNLGEIHLGHADGSLARDALMEALSLCTSLGYRSSEIEVRTRLASAYRLLGERTEAEAHLIQALAMAAAGGSLHLHEIHLGLSDLYREGGDHERALHHYRLFHETRELAWGEQAGQRIRAAVVQAELEQAARDATVLQERNDALERVSQEKSQLLDALAQQAAALERLSLEDALTGVPNRRYLDAQLALEWERCRRFGHALTFALLDVDHFKQVNDTHSHAAGDAVLCAIAAYLRAHTRRIDIIARYGGEEFALVFVETALAEAAASCEQLREGIEALDLSSIVAGMRITVSLGVASANTATTIVSLVADADAQLYSAKRAGRNRVCSQSSE